ncbi:TPA: transcriptional regulator [Yersinia enterocolitica]|uniref:transcriptional regulator n=1 Tax=Yersinia enterocolitica TaxID=630 RepID=UPI0029BCB4EE|nr:transcriptional regulator [Yersinia enterocolitica]EKN5104254.1 transcriptional regulator [Yersinia enterocolitica]EKN6091024.1 transcriptional regulator [Yersinia enterocolitica]ELX2238782.1 transcriptional regulator [Yersinia enterocolitica]ELY5241987.1 transcriptional regulator [Yersinia enterocolitica]
MYNLILFTNILRILEERGMTKSELHEVSGVSISFLSDLTNGKANPSLKVMEAIADALDTPLPILLESTDLDQDSLDALAGGKMPRSLPEGYERVSAIVTEPQAYIIKKWHEAAQKKIDTRTS